MIRGYVTIKDVRRAINRMKNGKSPGANGVPVEAWKICRDEDLQLLVDDINKLVIDEADMPKDWVS